MKWTTVLRVPAPLVAVVALATPAHAQYCFNYMLQDATVPIECVTKDLSGPCAWPADCTSIVDPTVYPALPGVTHPNSELAMHSEWHECFGATGGSDPPPGRGARWIAFHRQMELDFDVWRFQNAECDPANDHRLGCAVEYLPWHTGMDFPYGQGPIQAVDAILPGLGNGDSCGSDGTQRPGFIEGGSWNLTGTNGVTCDNCRPFPQCFINGSVQDGIPIACDGATADPFQPFSCIPGCTGFDESGNPYAYSMLQEFQSVDEIGRALDLSLHGELHGNVGEPFSGSNFQTDAHEPNCSPRDPMFWRLHKVLDETARAWQELQPVDVSIVLDTSGSMGEQDVNGRTKMDVALEASRMFADVLAQYNAEKSSTNRVGVVSYDTDGDLRVALQPAEDAKPDIDALNLPPGGCTGIGKGLQFGLQQLCPDSIPSGGDETDASCFAAPSTGNKRRAIVLLTDGLENSAPCLAPNPSAATNGCGSSCAGPGFDFARMGVTTELCAVGFGEAGSLNGPLLTLLAERQGGIYMESPDEEPGPSGDWIDLKEFFVKCLGTITQSQPGIDPKGVLESDALQTEPVSYSGAGCGDTLLNFTSGWKNPEALRLMVNTPSGDLLQRDGSISGSRTDTYEFDVVSLPYNGEVAGEWRSQLVRPHRSYVNGITTDSLDLAVAVPLVRRQIQRLCPEGCQDVLYYEDGHLGPDSSYELALAAEVNSGLLQSVIAAVDANDFDTLLNSQAWQLVVYAHQMTQGDVTSYDQTLADLLCNDQAAIVTETREVFDDGGTPYTLPSDINACAGAVIGSSLAENFTEISGDGLLFNGVHALTDHGYDRFSYAFNVGSNPDQIAEAQGVASLPSLFPPAVVAESDPLNISGESPVNVTAESWFMNVLVDGPSRLKDWPMVGDLRTAGQGLLASFRILPANMPPGGFDEVVATVEVERPQLGNGVGQIVQDNWPQPSTPSTTEDFLEGRPAAVKANGGIPTEVVGPFTLNDNGLNGDLHANNGIWSVQIPTEAQVDGAYKLHFKVALTLNGCTTQREFFRTKFVEIQVDPGSTIVGLEPNGGGGITVDLDPTDEFGNPWGPGRGGDIECGPAPECQCDPSDIVDNGDGTYTVDVTGNENCRVIVDDVPISVSDDPTCAPDTEPPTIDASEEVYISTCSSDTDPVYFEAPEITDNCSHDLEARMYAVTGLVIESNGVPVVPPVPANHHGSFDIGLGTHVVEWTVVDESGNTSVAQQMVHVIPGVSAGQSLLVRDRAVTVNRDVGLAAVANLGSGLTRIGVEAQVGRIDSIGSVDLRDRAVVDGSVSSSGSISQGNDVEINGSVNPFMSLPLPAPPDLSDVVVPPPTGGNHTANSGTTLTLAPGSYGSVTLNSGSTLKLQDGDYYFQTLTISSQVTALVTSGTPTLVIQNGFTYRSSFMTTYGELARVIIAFLGNGSVVLEAPLRTSLVAPLASVSLGTGNAIDFFGSFHARVLELRSDSVLHCSAVDEDHFTTSASCTDGVQNGSEEGVDCGGSCPNACPNNCSAVTYQAETMFHSTGASTPGGWNIWNNGYISSNHAFNAGPATVTVTAKGQKALNVWPHMVVSVGGVPIGNVNVTSSSWSDYTFAFTATGGSQEIRIIYDNDFYLPPLSDRNLLVDKAVVGCPGGGQ